MLHVYTYAKCSTCRKATRWLQAHGIAFEERPIRETPPSRLELKWALDLRKGEVLGLFNTSGRAYRALRLKEKLPDMPNGEALALLAENWNLVKRPFAVDASESVVLSGFNEARWEAALL